MGCHPRVVALGLGHVRDDPAGHFHGHERIAVDVGIGGQPKFFKSFAKLSSPQSALAREFIEVLASRLKPAIVAVRRVMFSGHLLLGDRT